LSEKFRIMLKKALVFFSVKLVHCVDSITFRLLSLSLQLRIVTVQARSSTANKPFP